MTRMLNRFFVRCAIGAFLVRVCGVAFAEESPRLVVAVLVDQLRYDYLERFNAQFSKGGFRRLMEQGCFLTSVHYDYFPTVTAPGHASLWSGATPMSHGIIANDWFDRSTGRMRYCVGDETVEGVGTSSPAGRMSPRNFVGSTFADEFRLRFGGRVVGVSLKDRGAILPAGRRPAGAYWFESASGRFVTSSYYCSQLPEWVAEFNARKLPESFEGKKWTRLLPADSYQWPDAQIGEGALAGEKAGVFDHEVRRSPQEGFETLMPTPFGNELLLEFTRAAVAGEKLGTGPRPDLLCVSFSSLDYCGHRFGPYSQEVQDVMLRLDLQIQALLEFLDQRVGRGRFVLALGADHGVAPTPEFAAEQGLGGARFDPVETIGKLAEALSGRFGEGRWLLTPRMVEGNLFLNRGLIREKGVSESEICAFVRDWALGTGWFQACYSRDQILDGRVPGPVGERVFRGFHPERSGDLVLILKPFVLAGLQTSGTTHGSVYSYDTHIPVLLYGPGVRPGRLAHPCMVSDVVPTLCSLLGMVEPAGSLGRPVPGVQGSAAEPSGAVSRGKK